MKIRLLQPIRSKGIYYIILILYYINIYIILILYYINIYIIY
jgi:hypothetical protein